MDNVILCFKFFSYLCRDAALGEHVEKSACIIGGNNNNDDDDDDERQQRFKK